MVLTKVHRIGRVKKITEWKGSYPCSYETSGTRHHRKLTEKEITYEKATEELSFEKETTGAIFSYQVKCIKPEAEIYKLLLDRYHLVPQECVFIDDRPENIETAEKLGITGIQFQNQQQAKRRLLELGVVSGS